MGGADFVNVLFSEFLVYDPENPRWEGRDRFFLDYSAFSSPPKCLFSPKLSSKLSSQF